MKTISDIAYSESYTEHRLLDVYLPGEPNGACVLLIHGGGFKTGNKLSWGGVPEWLTSRGFACITPTYRKRPEFMFPAWVEDIRLAMQFTLLHADEYGYSKEQIVTMGSSAGGYLTFLLAVLNENSVVGITDELTEFGTPAAAIPLCPVVRMREGVHIFSGDENQPDPPESDILKLISGKTPPMLFIHGTEDNLIPFSVSEEAVSVLNEKGGRAELAALEGVGHGYGYGTESDAQKQMLVLVDEFLKKVIPAYQ